MIPTLPYLQRKFDEYNQQMFGGVLPLVPIKLGHAKTTLGTCSCKRRRNADGTWANYDFKLRFSTFRDLSERDWDDILLHEMIHYYIGVRQYRDSSTHGRLFKSVMGRINTVYGRNITIRYHETAADRVADTTIRPHVVAVVRMKDGHYGIKVLPRTRQSIARYCTRARFSAGVAAVELFVATDAFFNGFPASAAMKIHPMEKSVIDAHLADAKRLKI